MCIQFSRIVINLAMIFALLQQGTIGFVFSQSTPPSQSPADPLLPPVNGPFPTVDQHPAGEPGAITPTPNLTSEVMRADPASTALPDQNGARPKNMILGQEPPKKLMQKDGSTPQSPGEKLIPNAQSPAAPTEEEQNPSAELEGIETAEWTTIMSESFESWFPRDNWNVYDNDGATDGEYYWNNAYYRSFDGTTSVWPATGGANGLDPDQYETHYYPNNTHSWMVYGPFSLSDAVDAELRFHYWNKSEPENDEFFWGASKDGINFFGYSVSGDSGGWLFNKFDLTSVPAVGNLAGEAQVWVAFSFNSDSSNVDEGAFIDRIALRKDISTAPDIIPITPSGWSSPIVPSSITGTNAVNDLYAYQDTYIDWALVNNGIATTTPFASCLYYDEAQIQCWNTNSLDRESYAYIQDWVLTLVPSIGYHTLRFITDVNNDISESNESNNTWEASFYWQGQNGPDLTPYALPGWESPIVPSSITGTHTVDTLSEDQSTYIDWAVINTGSATNTSFISCLYFDDSQLQCWNSDGLNEGSDIFSEDWELNVSPLYNSHTLTLVTDVNNDVSERNESNNSWSGTFYWGEIRACDGYDDGSVNSLTLDIPDDGSWTSWNLFLSTIPAQAEITDVAVKLAINHPVPDELEFYLSHNGEKGISEPVSLLFEKKQDNSPIFYSQPLTEFAKDTAGGIWTVWVRDAIPGNQGQVTDASMRASAFNPASKITLSGSTDGVPASFKVQNRVSQPKTTPDEEKLPKTGMPAGQPVIDPGDWIDIFVETFEGDFPDGNWDLFDNHGYGCDYAWDEDDYRSMNGDWAAWPANGGARGLDPETNLYPKETDSWMVYGPFDLSDATSVRLSFNRWIEAWYPNDTFYAGFSTDGSVFDGLAMTGYSDWENESLVTMDYNGEPYVWVGLLYRSDNFETQSEGVWVDDIRIQKYTGEIIPDCTNGYIPDYLAVDDLYAAYSAAHENTTPLAANNQPEDYKISMITRQFTPPVGLDSAVQSLMRTASVGQQQHMLVQLYSIPTDQQIADLENAGLKLQHYIPDKAWISLVEADQLGTLKGNPLVRWIGPLTTTDRTSPMFHDPSVQTLMQSRDGGTLAVTVEFAEDVDLVSGKQMVTGLGGKIFDEVKTINALTAIIPIDRLSALAAMEGVVWVEPPLPEFDPLNDCVREKLGVNELQAAPYNLNGSGVDILVYDAGTVSTAHPGFTDRLVVGDTSDVDYHATHVAGTAAGSGLGRPPKGRDLKGMAPAADVISYGFEDPNSGWLYTSPGDIERDWSEAKNTHGADLGTASIGTNTAGNGFDCEWEGNYGSVSQLIDGIVRGSLGEPYITTWAAGNERSSGRCGTTYNTTAPPSNAKNPIHVGATSSDIDEITSFSSWGPSDDGRIKPTISAPGCEALDEGGINSAVNYDTYGVMCGTSMAAPAVAGVVSLMIQQYRSTYSSSGEPLPSTIKALLIHTAVDKGNTGPDYQYGYGRVDGISAINALTRGDFKEDTFTVTEEYHSYTFNVGSAIPELKASLAWDDAPASPAALTQLVNDLDLVVISPSGQSYYPFILDPASPASAATNGEDHLNNQEQVIIPNPTSGTWTVIVKTKALPVSEQRYSIIFSSASDAPVSKIEPCFTLTTTASPIAGGTIDASPAPNCDSGTTYSHGTVVTLTAAPYTGYRFINWSGDVTGPNNPASVTMTTNRSVTASFGQPPFSFNKTSPANGADVYVSNPTLSWAASSEAASYDYCYDITNDNACSSWVSNGTATSKELSGLAANTTYYWQVRATNSAGTTYANESSTAFWSLKTGAFPTAFVKLSPSNTVTGQPANTTLSWGASSEATTYSYCYDTTNDNACATWQSTGASTSVVLSGLAANTTYYWQARAINSLGTTYANDSATAFWSFRTAALPTAFAKTSPANGATGQPTNMTLNWSASSGATDYSYCYDTTNDNACATWQSAGTSTSAVLSDLPANTTYYWQVRATNSFGTTFGSGSSTAFWSFRTAALPTAFAKTSPSNNVTDQPASTTLSWDVSYGTPTYWYCYDTTNDNACTNWQSNGTNTSVMLSELIANTTYYWQTRATNSFGTTYADESSTAFWSFQTANLPSAFAKSSPPNTITGQPANTTLRWGASNGTLTYWYCYDTTNDNACTSWKSAGTSTSVVLSGLAANTTYYWQVRATNSFGTTYANGSSTAFWSLKTRTLCFLPLINVKN